MQKYLLLLIGLLLTLGLVAGCGNQPATATVSPATQVQPTLAPATIAPTADVSPTSAGVKPTTVTTPTVAPQSASQGDVVQGKTLFLSSCSACHGPDAKGVKGLGKDMTTSHFIASKSDPELLAFIKQGRPTSDPLNTTGVPMPPKGGNSALTDDQLLDIIAYIRTVHN